MIVKWYWFALAGIVGMFALLWLIAGRDRATMDARVSLNTPINCATAAAYGGGAMFDLFPQSNPLRFDGDEGGGGGRGSYPEGSGGGAREGGDDDDPDDSGAREVPREQPHTTPAGAGAPAERKHHQPAPEVRAAAAAPAPKPAAPGIAPEAVRGIARRYGLAVTSVVPSPRLPLREGAHLPGTVEGVRLTGADLTPRLPPTLPAPSTLSVARAKQEGGGSKTTEKYYQGLTRRAAERVFGVKFKVDQRPDWLRSPLSGRNLELDLLNEEIGVAVEYNGYQHYVYPNKWHPSTDEGIRKFLRGVRNDEIKRKICDEVGVYLIVVPYSAHDFDERAESQIEAFLRKYHPDEEAKRQKAAARGIGATGRPDVVVTSHNLLDDEDLEEVDEDE